MITFEDIKKISGIEFNLYEEYIGSKRDQDFKIIEDSHYIYYPESNKISYGGIKHTKLSGDINPDDLLITSPVMTGSDYSGTTVELSNYEVFKEIYSDLLGTAFFDVYGGYSSFGIAISVKWLLNPDNEEKAQEILDTLKGLSDYPLIDEDHLSNMESEKEYEWVTGDGFKYDFIRELKQKKGLEIEDFTPDNAWQLYRDISERINVYPLFEDNGAPWIEWDRIAESTTIEDLKKYNIPFEVIS